ncbi:MAG TPA: NrfD/PsrC family molybdoenzyme membrane anchor subunit [Thermoanaerobaculia bacterium]|nr:NrfD/PsrC family molybdoenzyme membrane anchor subunit [Thermoanaerobaculia bacterium]
MSAGAMAGSGDRARERLALNRFRPWLVVATLASGALTLLFFYAWGYQLWNGIGVVGMNRPVSWGIYESTFVFWIGISHAGTLISAILRVTGAEWRRPVTRCAEAITVFALCVGGLFPILHLGRAWKVYYVMPLPNSRGLWPNYRSPLAWDSVAISAYLIGSILYLGLPLLPDLAILRDRASGWRKRFWTLTALGWSGTAQQWRSLEAGIKVMAIVIIPLAVSVHTIVSWDFAMTLVPMWNSTIFGPYFVVGAIYSGIAALLVAMALLRFGLKLGDWLTDSVFSKLALLFLVMTMAWGYFTFSEHLTAWYANEVAEARVLWTRLTGAAAPPFWTMVVLNFVVPMLVLPFRRGRRPVPLCLVGIGVLIGMWLERILIVVPSLATPRLAYTVGSYTPSWVELSILAGSAGLFLFLYLVFMQAAPILSVWEIAEGERHEAGPSPVGAGGASSAGARTAGARRDAGHDVGAAATGGA